MTPRWQAGDTILWTQTWRGERWTERPLQVVEDDGASILAWHAPGSVASIGSPPDGVERSIDWVLDALGSGVWEMRRSTWRGGGALMWFPAGRGHAIWAMFTEDDDLKGWYVNVQDPPTRTELGVEAMDHLLDVVVSADLTGWHLKDEDHLSAAAARGLYRPEQVDAIRAEADAFIEALARGCPPFDPSFAKRRPR